MSRTQRLTATLAAAVGLIAILALPGVAAAKDRNHDHIPDGWEKRHNLSLKVNQARRDQDGDHLRNRAEFEAETNPRDPDSDNDGIPDGEEHAGEIESFNPTSPNSGELTIALFGGGQISGLVTEETEIECHRQASATASASSEGDETGEEGGNDEASEEEQQGEGQGDDGSEEEAGDDQGEQEGGSSSCTAADLTPGTMVDEAELKVENGTAVFEKVELAG